MSGSPTDCPAFRMQGRYGGVGAPVAQVPRKRRSWRGLWGQRPQESGARTCAAPEGGAGSGLAPRGAGRRGHWAGLAALPAPRPPPPPPASCVAVTLPPTGLPSLTASLGRVQVAVGTKPEPAERPQSEPLVQGGQDGRDPALCQGRGRWPRSLPGRARLAPRGVTRGAGARGEEALG